MDPRTRTIRKRALNVINDCSIYVQDYVYRLQGYSFRYTDPRDNQHCQICLATCTLTGRYSNDIDELSLCANCAWYIHSGRCSPTPTPVIPLEHMHAALRWLRVIAHHTIACLCTVACVNTTPYNVYATCRICNRDGDCVQMQWDTIRSNGDVRMSYIRMICLGCHDAINNTMHMMRKRCISMILLVPLIPVGDVRGLLLEYAFAVSVRV